MLDRPQVYPAPPLIPACEHKAPAPLVDRAAFARHVLFNNRWKSRESRRTVLDSQQLMKTFYWTFLTIPFLCLTAFSQTSTLPAQCNEVREIVKPGGWDIPGISETQVKNTARFATDEDKNIMVTILESKSPTGVFTYMSPMRGVPNRYILREQPVRVREIRRFEKYGKVFAYRIDAVYVAVSGRDLAAETPLLFYDLDGSGRFQVLRFSAGDFPFKLIIPYWVRDLKPAAN